MIEETSDLTRDNAARQLLVEDLRGDLRKYVAEFEKVTEWQAQRNDLVNNRLNVLGPQTERALTSIMTSALTDGDTIAAYQAGVTLRNLLLGRLYANRFLIQNDDASVDRAMREFRDMELNVEKLLAELQDPKRRELADRVKVLQDEYMAAFVQVRRVITNRNILITHQLDRIGPEVADRVERLKLSIKAEQDTLGPQAQAAILRAETITVGASIVAIIFGVLVAGWMAAGLTRPVRDLTVAAKAMAAGDLEQAVDTERRDEIGTLARAFVAMREAINDKVTTLENEIATRRRAEEGLAEAQEGLRKANAELEEKVRERTAELADKEAQLRVALSNMSDGIFTLDGDWNFAMFNERYLELTGLPRDLIGDRGAAVEALRYAAERGYYGRGEPDELVEERLAVLMSGEYAELDATTTEGRILHYRKSPMDGGGAIVVVTDVTESKKAERELNKAFHNISNSINYASRIQRSILPPSELMAERLQEHFVFWEPRDVIGGDVYWCHDWGEGVLLMLGDCTGHGVPGALMTLISTGALERAMGEVPAGDVAALVQRMHQLLRRSLGQDSGSGSANDGLELGVCFIEPGSRRLTFVGARFNLFIINSGHIEEIRGDRKGIGYPEVDESHVFEATVVDASKKTRFYMTTDGAIDQIDEADRRRFGKSRFKELLLEVQDQPMSEQGEVIRGTIERHQGAARRLDDIAVVGFNI